MSHSAENDAPDHLGLFLQFADTVQAAWERAHRPVYAETCRCGGSVEVSREATAAERRRIWSTFVGRHQECLTRVAPPAECAITKSTHCHLQGVRYNAKPCVGGCDLSPEGSES